MPTITLTLSAWTIAAYVLPLLLIEGFFSGSEIALLSADKMFLKAAAKKGSHRAQIAMSLANHPDRVLSVTLLVTCLCVIGISALVSIFIRSVTSSHHELIAIAVTSPLVVVIGELIPKAIYQKRANQLAPWVAIPVQVAYWVLIPFTGILSAYTSRLSKLAAPVQDLIIGGRQSSRDELRSLLTYSKRDSELKASEKRMIKRIFDFKDTEAKHALIPLVKIEAIERSATVRQALERFREHRHSRMPVFSGRIDSIVGVIEASDLLLTPNLDDSISGYITPARYAPETQSLDDLMHEMRREDNEMVVVVDEYGGAVGILTFEDIIEEIVGEINDEYDSEQTPYKEIGPSAWQAQARTEIQNLNEKLKLDVPEGDYETLGGFLLQQFGRIPEGGDELYFDTPTGLLKFTIRKANERQIESVQIERISKAGKTGAAGSASSE